MTTTTINKQKTFVKTDKNREQVLKEYNNTCYECNKDKKDGLDVYIIDINIKPHTIVPLCKSCYEVLMRQEENYDRQVRNMIVSKENEQEYKEAKYRFRNNLKNAYDDMNTMIRILHEDNPGWSIKRIIKQILLENEDIIGISERSIYNHLDEQNKALIDTRFQNKNNVLEDSGATLHPQVIEESSIYKEVEDTESQSKELTDKEKEIVASKILRKDIYDYANEREISADKKLMLTNSRLQKHPKLQESLINQLTTKNNNEAKVKVAQTIMDLETGTLFKNGNSYIVDETSREKVDLKGKEVKHPGVAYLDIVKSVKKLCESLTDKKLDASNWKYTEDDFKYTKEFRQEIIRSNNNKHQLIALYNNLVLIQDYGIPDFIKMIEEALEDFDKKPDIGI